MATVTTIPALVLPKRSVQFVFAATSSGNFVKVWCTSAPRGSALRKQLDESGSERVIVIAESDIGHRPSYTFDVGGAYALQVEEFQKGAEAYGGSYRGSPDGFRTEDRVVAPTTVTLHVASLLEATIGVSPDTATLQVYVSDQYIVQTTKATHGATTPAIVRPASDKARAASDTPSVIASATALSNTFASGAIGDLQESITNFIDQFNTHRASAVFHDTADSNNEISDAFREPRTLKATIRSLAECAKKFDLHVRNVDPTSTTPEPGSADYHVVGGQNVADWANVLLAGGGSDMGACLILMADLWRCYEAHRVSTDVHLEADEISPLNTQAPLEEFHTLFLRELAALSPTVPANEHTAKVLLVSGAGFKEV